MFFNLTLILSLVMALLDSTAIPASAGSDREAKADPRLLQLAVENPDATFMVIVEREVKNKNVNEDNPETEVAREGGRVKNQFKVIESFSAEMSGKQILKLAMKRKVRWISADARMVSAGGPGMETVRDEFQSLAYNGNVGTQTWSRGWTEGDSSGDAAVSTADVEVFKVGQSSCCAGGSGYCLHAAPDIAGGYIYRQAGPRGMVSVWLSFYRNNLLNANLGVNFEQVQLPVSSNGDASWTTLQIYSGVSKLGVAIDTFDISAYASANTRIRFIMPTVHSGTRYLYVDDVEIAFARPSAFLATVKADQYRLLATANQDWPAYNAWEAGSGTSRRLWTAALRKARTREFRSARCYRPARIRLHGTMSAGTLWVGIVSVGTRLAGIRAPRMTK